MITAIITSSSPTHTVANATPGSVVTVAPAVCPQRRGGRKRDPVWSDVVMFEDKTAVCSKCEVVIHELGFTHVERVRHHMTQRCPKRAKTAKISTLFPPALKGPAHFHQALMNWAFQKSISFNALQDPALLFVVQQLHPEATIPTDKAMRTVFLNQAYETSVARIKQSASGKLVSFSTDGWTDVNGMAVINYVAICGAKTYYLESVYTGSISLGTAFIAADLKRVMAKYSFLQACAVVTDNISNKGLWEQLQTEFPRVFFHGCAAHVVHLMVKEICSSISWLGNLAIAGKAVVKFFKKRHLLHHELQEALRRSSRRTLALPVETRWGHEGAEGKKRVIHDIIRSGSFVPNLERGQKLLEILTKFSRRFECNETPTSDVYEMFTKRPELVKEVGLTAAEKASSKTSVSGKFNFLYGDAHGVAYVLDPRFIGKEIDSVTRVRVENLICTWNGSDSADDSSGELL